MNKIIVKPFLKWVGGKTQIIDDIIDNIPDEINNYYECFVGGGSVLLALLSYQKNNKIKITGDINVYDINENLINLYNVIKNDKDKFIEQINIYIDQYKNIETLKIDEDKKNKNKLKKTLEESLLSKERYYYWIRNIYNLSNLSIIETSALFVFLNKTCFKGLYRCNTKTGYFNVPFGNYNNPKIIDEEHINEIHSLIQNVKFNLLDFSKSLDKKFDKNDYIYLDPPYVPENKKSFVDYNKSGFNIDCHNKLFDMIHQLTNDNIKITLSNSDTDLVNKNFNNNKKYYIKKINIIRRINSKKPNSTTDELIINNYVEDISSLLDDIKIHE